MTICLFTTDSKKEEGILVEADCEVVPRVGDTINFDAHRRSCGHSPESRVWAELSHWEWKVIACHHQVALMPDDTCKQRVLVEVGARKKLL